VEYIWSGIEGIGLDWNRDYLDLVDEEVVLILCIDGMGSIYEMK